MYQMILQKRRQVLALLAAAGLTLSVLLSGHNLVQPHTASDLHTITVADGGGSSSGGGPG